MTLEVLSSIKGATSSAAVDQLFEEIKKAETHHGEMKVKAVTLNDLRADEVKESSEMEKSIIRNNFPMSKNGFLVVSKVIEE